MTDISNPPVHAPLAHLATQPGYYYLYALYADYQVNNAWFRNREYAALLRERLRVIQPLLAMVQPYRKSPALRLFTERQGRDRFPTEKMDEAYRQLRNLIQRVGPPPGWPDGEAPPTPRYRHSLPANAPRREGGAETTADIPAGETATETATKDIAGLAAGTAGENREESTEPAPRSRKSYPKSPVDYSKRV